MIRKILPAAAILSLFSAAAFAADPPKTPAPAAPAAKAKMPDPNRKIVRWPGGWMYMDEPGIIYHDDTPLKAGGSLNVIADSANGTGNSIVIDGATPGTTIIKNARNGVGNSIRVTPDGPIIDLSAKPALKLDPTRYKGQNAKFWTRKLYSDGLGYNIYWCPKAELWFKYDKMKDMYVPITNP